MRRVLFAVFCAVTASSMAAANTAFVSNEKDNTITVLDLTSWQDLKTVPVGRRPRGMVLSPDMKSCSFGAGDDNRVDVMDTATFEIIRPA